jgi:hypothetical protein
MKIIQVGAPMFQHLGKYYKVEPYQVTTFQQIASNIESREKLGYNVCFWYDLQATDEGRSLYKNVLVYRCKFMKSEYDQTNEVMEEAEEVML